MFFPHKVPKCQLKTKDKVQHLPRWLTSFLNQPEGGRMRKKQRGRDAKSQERVDNFILLYGMYATTWLNEVAACHTWFCRVLAVEYNLKLKLRTACSTDIHIHTTLTKRSLKYWATVFSVFSIAYLQAAAWKLIRLLFISLITKTRLYKYLQVVFNYTTNS